MSLYFSSLHTTPYYFCLVKAGFWIYGQNLPCYVWKLIFHCIPCTLNTELLRATVSVVSGVLIHSSHIHGAPFSYSTDWLTRGHSSLSIRVLHPFFLLSFPVSALQSLCCKQRACLDLSTTRFHFYPTSLSWSFIDKCPTSFLGPQTLYPRWNLHQ